MATFAFIETKQFIRLFIRLTKAKLQGVTGRVPFRNMSTLSKPNGPLLPNPSQKKLPY